MNIDGVNENVITLIMAAGKGTRMNSKKSKLVQKIYDKELVKRVVELAQKIESDEIITVVGTLKNIVDKSEFPIYYYDSDMKNGFIVD